MIDSDSVCLPCRDGEHDHCLRSFSLYGLLSGPAILCACRLTWPSSIPHTTDNHMKVAAFRVHNGH
jgi:hypothetical protein